MASVLRVMVVVALSSVPGLVSAATAERQTDENLQDVLLGMYAVSGPDITGASSVIPLVLPNKIDSCRCDTFALPGPDPNNRHGIEPYDCLDWESEPSVYDFSCTCAEPVRLQYVHDDNIRGQMRTGTDLLRILPLWHADTALEIQPDGLGHDCAAGSGQAGSSGLGGALSGASGGSGLIYSATVGAGSGSAGGLSGGGAAGSGGLVGRKSPPEDRHIDPGFEPPIPTPLPPAGLMFVSALAVLGLGRALRRRYTASRCSGALALETIRR